MILRQTMKFAKVIYAMLTFISQHSCLFATCKTLILYFFLLFLSCSLSLTFFIYSAIQISSAQTWLLFLLDLFFLLFLVRFLCYFWQFRSTLMFFFFFQELNLMFLCFKTFRTHITKSFVSIHLFAFSTKCGLSFLQTFLIVLIIHFQTYLFVMKNNYIIQNLLYNKLLCKMADQQDINQLKAKLQKQAAQFQSYKEQCKNLEQMLEEQSQKKEQQIRQLKEESIKREKGQKMLKAQASQLEAQVQNLKGQLKQTSNAQSSTASNKQQVQKLTKQNASLKEKNTQSETKIQQLTALKNKLQGQLDQQQKKVEKISKLLTQAQNTIKSASSTTVTVPVIDKSAHTSSNQSSQVSKLQQQIKKLKQKVSILQKQKAKFQKSSKQKQNELQKLKHQYEQKLKKHQAQTRNISKERQQKPSKRQHSSETKQPKQVISLTQHKLQQAKLRQVIHNLEQKCQKLQHNEKEYKQKSQALLNEKNNLLHKVKSLGKQFEKERDRANKLNEQNHQQGSYESPTKKEGSEQIIVHQNNVQQDISNGVVFDCLLLTKKHYLSPFIDIKDNKIIKLFKSTKNGFEKSLGATKHRFNTVGYDSENLVNRTAASIKQNEQRELNRSIVIYGSKFTSKKGLMAGLMTQLKDWLLQRVEVGLQENAQVQCIYMKRSLDQEKNYLKQASNNREQIQQIIDEIISMGQKGSPSKGQKSKKTQKPKIRYFGISIGQDFNLEVITTSYLNPFIKNNETFKDYLNTIIFSKLPNILQSGNTTYHIITTINPIVNLYEECKNTLSITLVPNKDSSSNNGYNESTMSSHIVMSPSAINKDDLNDITKKKVQTFEKETEQAGLKVRKIEQQCNYYKNRFQQLQVRLKNLVNTHQQQNAYLKKSPVTLSYEKLLKFVNTVLARNNNSSTSTRGNISPNFGQTYNDHHQEHYQEHHQEQVNIYIEEDAKSLDGY